VRKGRKLQIIDLNGIAQLSQSEVDAVGDVGQVFLTIDDESPEIFTWTTRLDPETNEYALVYQWYDSDLIKQYGPEGITIDTLDGFNWRHLYYLPGPQNSVYVCRTFPDDGRLYAQRFNRNGPMWSEWLLVHAEDWEPLYRQWTYALVTTDGSLIVPLYSNEEFGFVRIRPDGSLGAPVSIRRHKSIPGQLTLGIPYPNPFNPSTTIEYDLPDHSDVSLIIYDIAGREVQTLVSRSLVPGNYQVNWNGTNQQGKQVAGGMYFARLQAGGYSSVVKMVYLR